MHAYTGALTHMPTSMHPCVFTRVHEKKKTELKRSSSRKVKKYSKQIELSMESQVATNGID